MSAIERLLNDYEAVAEAAIRFLESGHCHGGEHERRCEAGQCLKSNEAYIEAGADLRRELAKVTSGPFRSDARRDSHGRPSPLTQQEMKDLRGSPAEYLRRFFSELERLKRRSSCDVSHAIGFRDGKLHVLMSIGDFRERVYVEELDQDPTSAAQDVFLEWRTSPRFDDQIE